MGSSGLPVAWEEATVLEEKENKRRGALETWPSVKVLPLCLPGFVCSGRTLNPGSEG